MRRLALLPLALVTCLALAPGLTGCKGKPGIQQEGVRPEPAASAKAIDAVTIAPKMPAVGTKWEETRKSAMSLKMSIDIGLARNKGSIDDQETTIEKSEVLAVEGKVVTKKKLTYVEKTKRQTENGKEKVAGASPVAGKTYVLAWVSGKAQVTDEAGKPVPPEEEEVVLKSHRAFGKPDPLFDGFPAGAIRVGDEVPSLRKALQENLADAEDGNDHPEFFVDSVKLTALEKGPELLAVFTVQITLQTPADSKDPFAMQAQLGGTMKVRAKDAWLVGMELKGPLGLTGRDPSFKVEGKGEMTMQFANAY